MSKHHDPFDGYPAPHQGFIWNISNECRPYVPPVDRHGSGMLDSRATAPSHHMTRQRRNGDVTPAWWQGYMGQAHDGTYQYVYGSGHKNGGNLRYP